MRHINALGAPLDAFGGVAEVAVAPLVHEAARPQVGHLRHAAHPEVVVADRSADAGDMGAVAVFVRGPGALLAIKKRDGGACVCVYMYCKSVTACI